jgi:UDP-glucose 4-epimerase
MNILITGGAGYIGTELCLRLMDRPEVTSIAVYDNLSRGNFNFFLGPEKRTDKVRFVDAELLDSYTLRKEIAKADCVVHLAAKVTTPFADQNPHLFDQVNNWGTAELCYGLDSSDCQRLIYMSSASVYGASTEAAGISTVPNPKTFYGISKLSGEKHVERLQGKKDVAIVRCANVYGYSKSMRFDAVINRFVLRARNHGRININGSGDQDRAFVHISRVVDFLEALVFGKTWQPYYNLSDRNLTVNDIAYALKEILPEMEMLYVDQQLSLRQIRLAEDPNVTALIGKSQKTLDEELRAFLEKMA